MRNSIETSALNPLLARAGDEEIVKILDSRNRQRPKAMPIGERLRAAAVGSLHHEPRAGARGSVDHRSDPGRRHRLVSGAPTDLSGDHIGNAIAGICADESARPSSFVPTAGHRNDRFFELRARSRSGQRFQSVSARWRGLAALIEAPEARGSLIRLAPEPRPAR
jgi:hypothetical protein